MTSDEEIAESILNRPLPRMALIEPIAAALRRVREEEREACAAIESMVREHVRCARAVIASEWGPMPGETVDPNDASLERVEELGARIIAALDAIRARGEVKP